MSDLNFMLCDHDCRYSVALHVEHEQNQAIVCAMSRGTLALFAGQVLSSMCIVPVLTR